MERTFIGSLRQHIGETVRIQGWLQTLRDQKKMQFLILRDPTGLVQVAFWKEGSPDLALKISPLTAETALTITGKVVDNPIVKLGGLEVQLETLEVNALAEAQLPFDPFAETLPMIDFRMDWRYLDLRRPENLLIFKVQTTAEASLREYWIQNNFIEIHTPKIMGAPSESGAELFTLEYFDRKAYLAQSPQFYKQMAMAAGFERVFEIGLVRGYVRGFASKGGLTYGDPVINVQHIGRSKVLHTLVKLTNGRKAFWVYAYIFLRQPSLTFIAIRGVDDAQKSIEKYLATVDFRNR